MSYMGQLAKKDKKEKRWNPRGFKLPNFREKELSFPVFSAFPMLIVVTPDEDIAPTVSYICDRDFNREPSLRATCDACTMTAASRTYLFFKKKDATPGTIAHEAWHAIYHMLKDFAGAEIEDETVAYHLGYLVDQISQFIHDEEKVNVDSGSSHSTRVPRRARRRRVAKRAQKKS